MPNRKNPSPNALMADSAYGCRDTRKKAGWQQRLAIKLAGLSLGKSGVYQALALK